MKPSADTFDGASPGCSIFHAHDFADELTGRTTASQVLDMVRGTASYLTQKRTRRCACWPLFEAELSDLRELSESSAGAEIASAVFRWAHEH